MAGEVTYRFVYGFGHPWADCRGPGSATEPYDRFEYGSYGTTLPYLLIIMQNSVAASYNVCARGRQNFRNGDPASRMVGVADPKKYAPPYDSNVVILGQTVRA